jgi:hypothetical protein
VLLILAFFLVLSVWAGLKVLECELSSPERCDYDDGLIELVPYSPAFVAGFGAAIYFIVRRGRKARKLHNF